MEAFEELSDVEGVEQACSRDNSDFSEDDVQDDEPLVVDSPYAHRGHHTPSWPRRVAMQPGPLRASMYHRRDPADGPDALGPHAGTRSAGGDA